MSDSADRLLVDQLKSKSTVSTYPGTFLTVRNSRAVCFVLGGELEATFASTVMPTPGDSVRVELREGAYVMTGPAMPKGTRGVVTATTAVPLPPEQQYDMEGNPLPMPPIPDPLPDDLARCRVEIDGRSYALPYITGYTPEIDDVVAVEWTLQGGLVKGRVSMVPDLAPTIPTPPPTQDYSPGPFTAVGSDSWQGGSYNKGGRVWSSDSVKGVFVYGSKIADTIPDSAKINYVRLWLSPDKVDGDPANLRLHSNTSLSGGPSWQGSSWQMAPPSTAGWVQIPNYFADWLKANAGGVGFDSGGYHIFKSVATDPMSGALDINYTA